MLITAVERVKGKRGMLRVFGDGVVLFEISRETASKRALRPGGELDDAAIAAIVAEDARRRALRAAAAMLARRPRSEHDLRRRLAQRHFETSAIDNTIERLRAKGLIDDAEFARTWAESRDRTRPRGRRLIAGELRLQGVARGIADDAASAVDDAEAAWRAVERRLSTFRKLEDDAVRTRLAGFLRRRGFGWHTVRVTIGRAFQELGRNDVAHESG